MHASLPRISPARRGFSRVRLEVTVEGEVATLTGLVGSWLQREAAEHAAGSAPGITRVDNRITIVPTFVLEDMPDQQC